MSPFVRQQYRTKEEERKKRKDNNNVVQTLAYLVPSDFVKNLYFDFEN